MKRLSLRPYHGEIRLCDDVSDFKRQYKRITKIECPYDPQPKGGQFVLLEKDEIVDRIFLVYARNAPSLAHELCHVLLVVFDTIGHDPRKGDGEPFCYMLSQLMLDAGYDYA
jgi:hypothetical protein